MWRPETFTASTYIYCLASTAAKILYHTFFHPVLFRLGILISIWYCLVLNETGCGRLAPNVIVSNLLYRCQWLYLIIHRFSCTRVWHTKFCVTISLYKLSYNYWDCFKLCSMLLLICFSSNVFQRFSGGHRKVKSTFYCRNSHVDIVLFLSIDRGVTAFDVGTTWGRSTMRSAKS